MFNTKASYAGITKQLLFIPTRYGNVSAMFTEPEKKKKRLTLIMAHGIGPDNSMVESGRTFLRLAEKIAPLGCCSLMFAFPGTAESDGLFANMSPNQRVLAMRDVIDWFISSKLGPYAVLGFSMGGATAILALDHRFSADPAFLITINSVPSYGDEDESYHQWHAEAPEPHLTVGLGKRFFSEKPKRSVAKAYARLSLPKLHIQSGKDIKHFSKEFKKIFNQDDGLNEKTRIPIHGADHSFERAEHQKQLLSSIYEWVKERL